MSESEVNGTSAQDVDAGGSGSPTSVSAETFTVESPFGVIRDTMSLADREKGWGFTVQQLHDAAKVIKTLFHNPTLFVNDPYLTESRLYTMITRDRATKREFRDTYKSIMAEEKRRRQRNQSQLDQEILQKTVMKRERDEVFGALALARDSDLKRLRDDGENGDGEETRLISDKPPKLSADELENTDDALLGDEAEEVVDVDNTEDETDPSSSPLVSSPTTGGVDSSEQLSAEEKEMYSLIGAFENMVRLEEELSKPFVDWITATQLNAQVYRYKKHTFGSQMPPPLFLGDVPADVPDVARVHFIDGAKCAVAEKAVALTAKYGAARRAADKSSSSSSNVCDIRGEFVLQVNTVKALKAKAGETIADDDAAVVPDALAKFRAALLNGIVDDTLQSAYAAVVKREGAAKDGAAAPPILHAVRASLSLLIARHVYRESKYRDMEESPLVIDRSAPDAKTVGLDPFSSPFLRVQLWHGWSDEHSDPFILKTSKVRRCYICRIGYHRVHPFYYSMCPVCGEFNYNKRLMARDLRGKVVLLTGCRIKIGFAMALSLLRCGATLLGTTRFAHEALARFMAEPDYHLWKDRLVLFSLDLRDMWTVTQFCGFVLAHYPKLFAIVNNAAQTISRTPEYTARLRTIECQPPPALQQAIREHTVMNEWHTFFMTHTSVTIGMPHQLEFHPQTQPFLAVQGTDGAEGQQTTSNVESASLHRIIESGVSRKEQKASGGNDGDESSTIMSSVMSTAHGLAFDRYDMLAEMCDSRQKNSWTMNLHEVQGSEAAEVMAINALSPFILNSRLKPALENREGDTVPNEYRFIINVSAMEGKFYRYKQTTHPHTNMAKAALNMMTRTSSSDYAASGIYMSAVDTGWITDELPAAKQEELHKQGKVMMRPCPLDEVDAAARCLDLIFTNRTTHGKFWKDFNVTMW